MTNSEKFLRYRIAFDKISQNPHIGHSKIQMGRKNKGKS